MEKQCIYKIDNIDYEVNIKYKKMKNIIYKVKNGKFYVSCPYNTSLKTIFKYLDTIGKDLISKDLNYETPFDNNEVYYLGKKYPYYITDENKYSGDAFYLKSTDDFYLILKDDILKLFVERLKYYEKRMNIKVPYNLKISHLSSRYGSNSPVTHTISLDIKLIHYNLDVIDAVIIHELAHDNCYHHKIQFYEKIYLYCPNYDLYQEKLKKRIYE